MSDTATTSYLEQYDAADDKTKVGLALKWIRTDWRPFFKELRENRPILKTPNFTFVTRFADVTEVLSREKVFTVRPYQPHMDPVVGPFMLARDATPINWREKGIMQAVLKPEDLPGVRKMAASLAEGALDAAAPEGKIEAISKLCRFVPISIVGGYFGFPGPDLESMYRWSKNTQTNMFKNLLNDPAIHEAAVQTGKEMKEYLTGLLAEKRKTAYGKNGDAPQDTFSRLVRTQFPSEIGFDDERLLSNIMGLLVGTGETTSQAIAQSLEQILLQPEIHAQAAEAAKADDPAAFDEYVWEGLRLNPINPLIFRLSVEDYTVAAGTDRETVIPAGTLVFACTSSAGFDEDVLQEPETFRTDRPDFLSLHFGYGHHTCLGKYVGSVVIPEVVRRVLLRPNVHLLPPPEGKIDFHGGPFPESFWFGFGEASPAQA
ncbi:MAG TPA: cytochrome P450 [Actinomycetota bacterium]|nr:cytochrome P450 [Actinomycetota bacterium]